MSIIFRIVASAFGQRNAGGAWDVLSAHRIE
jgi:hypothetical protein